MYRCITVDVLTTPRAILKITTVCAMRVLVYHMSFPIGRVCARASDMRLCLTAESVPQHSQLENRLPVCDDSVRRLWKTTACVVQTFHAQVLQRTNDLVILEHLTTMS